MKEQPTRLEPKTIPRGAPSPEAGQAPTKRQEVFLGLMDGQDSLHEWIRMVAVLLRNWAGCSAAAVRLRDGDDFPYFKTDGFPDHFVEQERRLCAVDQRGELVRDSSGNPVLECMCGNVICGRTDLTKPFFTPFGSFWTNSTTDLLAGTTEADRQARTRNRCYGEGYESVALIPLRSGEKTFGLLQFNDKRKGRFTPEMIASLEQTAACLSAALANWSVQERLCDCEERYRALFDRSLDAVYLHDFEGRFLDANPAALKLLGYAREDIPALHLHSLLDADDQRVKARATLIELAETGTQKRPTEYRLKRKDGQHIWVETLACVVHKQGKPDAIQGIARDVTERKQMEVTLAQRSRWLATVNALAIELATLPSTVDFRESVVKRLMEVTGARAAWFCDYDPSDRTLTISYLDVGSGNLENISRLLQQSPKAMRIPVSEEAYRDIVNHVVGRLRTLTEVSFGTIPPEISAAIQELLGADHFIGIAYVIKGELYGTSMLGMPDGRPDPSSELLESFAHMVAVSLRRRRAEEALRESEDRFRSVLDNSLDVAYRRNLQADAYDYMSPAIVKVSGYQADEFASLPATLSLIHPDDRERTKQLIERALSGGPGPYHTEYRFRKKAGGYRWFGDLFTVVRDEQGRPLYLVGSVRDITERKEAEEALREVSHRLHQAQDEERRRIARDLHDSVAQELAALVLNLHMLESELPARSAEASRLLEGVLTVAEQCSQEVRTLSYLLHSPLLDQLGLISAVHSYVEGFSDRCGIPVALELPPELDRLPAEVELALFRVVQEGLSNMHRHSGSRTARIQLKREPACLVLEISDEGSGIPAETLQAIQQGLPGSGMGIAGMRERLRLLGGTLEIESSAHGTTIRAAVPLTRNQAQE